MINKKGDVWVSTVLYTMISLAIIGSLLAVVKPKIAEAKDKLILEQTIQSLNNLDETITRVREATGTRLSFKISVDKGNFVVDGINERIFWNGISSYKLSEANKSITVGVIDVLTVHQGSMWNVTIGRNYTADQIDLIVDNDAGKVKVLNHASLPYILWILNNGTLAGKQQITIESE